jgi:site-specific recombinase XerD
LETVTMNDTASNPFAPNDSPPQQRPFCLSRDQVMRLFEAVLSGTAADRALTRRNQAVDALLRTGQFYVSEMHRLNVSDFDPAAQAVRLTGNARRPERHALLQGPALATLRAWLEVREALTGPRAATQPALFLNANGGRLDRAGLRMAQAATLAGPSPQTSPARLQDRAMLALLYATGVRVTELTQLVMTDLNLDAGTVTVRGRGRPARTATLGPIALEALREWLSVRQAIVGPQAALVFLTAWGGKRNAGAVRRMLQRYVAIAGLDPRTTVDMLRRSFALHMLAGGADLWSVQRQLGYGSSVARWLRNARLPQAA